MSLGTQLFRILATSSFGHQQSKSYTNAGGGHVIQCFNFSKQMNVFYIKSACCGHYGLVLVSFESYHAQLPDSLQTLYFGPHTHTGPTT